MMLLILKASLLLAIVIAASRALHAAPASARHRLWSVAFAALLALPVLASALPALAVRAPAWTAPEPVTAAIASREMPAPAAGAPFASPSPMAPPDGGPPVSTPAASQASRLPAVTTMLAAAWTAGAAWGIGALAVGLWRVRRVARHAIPLADDDWTSAIARASARLGLRRTPRVLMSDRVVTPMAGGIARLTVFVPVTARAWDAERRDIVLAHEIAHLAGLDPLRQVVARVVLAIYWFHPLAWFAARQAEAAREQACDEAVIASGTRPSVYARVLLEFADDMPAASPALAALPMVQRTLLEKRLMAILDFDMKPRTRRMAALPAALVALVALPVAAAHPFNPVSESPATTGPVTAAEAPAPARVTPDPAQAPGDSACATEFADGGPFDGRISIGNVDGRDVILQQMGQRGSTRLIQQTFGATRVCMLAEGVGDHDGVPSTWIGRATRVILESRRDRESRRLGIAGGRETWTVNGAARPAGAESTAWRQRMLAVLDPAWELSSLRGEESSLRGEISSIYGERSSLQGKISSLYGEVSSMRGEISSIGGEESSLRGEISSLYGELSSLQGEISSARGEISSLNASRYDATDAERGRIAERIRRQEAEIARLEKQIRDFDVEGRVAAVERRIAALDANRKIEEMDRRIRAFDVDAKVRTVQERIAGLDVERRVAEIERRIASLDVDRRARALEERLAQAVRALDR